MLTDTLSAEDALPNPAWAILDTKDQWDAFSQTVENQGIQSTSEPLVQSNLMLDGLRCAACSGIIEQGLQATPGIISARVSMSKKTRCGCMVT